YRPRGSGRSANSRMVKIGPSPATSLADARRAAKGFAGAVARGDDPAAEKQEERRRASSTLRQLLADGGDYDRHLAGRHLVNRKTVMRTRRRGLGRLMGKDVAAITRADFVTAIVAIKDQGKPGAAADLRKCARTFCEWCVHRGFAPANVLAGLRQSKTTRAERLASEARRPRALADHEIIAVWNAADGRGTWLSFKNRGDLDILVAGDKRLFNQYGVILVNPEKHPYVKKDLGQAFINWLVSPEGQKAIADYKINGQ